MNDGTIDHHYHHHAVLSNNINGTWGTLVNDSAVINGDVFYHDFSFELPDPSIDSTYEVNNLSWSHTFVKEITLIFYKLLKLNLELT